MEKIIQLSIIFIVFIVLVAGLILLIKFLVNMSEEDYINLKDWVRETLGGGTNNWKVRATSGVAVIILAVLVVKYGLPLYWAVWSWSWAFFISLISLYLSTVAFASLRTSKGLLFVAISIAASSLYFANVPKGKWEFYQKEIDNQSTDKRWLPDTDKSQSQQNSEPVQPVYTFKEPVEIRGSRTLTLDPYEIFDFENLGPNSEMLIIGQNSNGHKLFQKVTTDSISARQYTYAIDDSTIFTQKQYFNDFDLLFEPNVAITFLFKKGLSNPLLTRKTPRGY